jgi:DNA-binding NarL/FixJ family response regulator
MELASKVVRPVVVSATTPAVRVLIVDDQMLFRRGLASLLADHPQVDVVAEAADGAEALAAAAAMDIDVVLMDLKMPNVDGVEATRRLAELHPGLKVVILTTFESDTYVVKGLKAGAVGYLLKDSTVEAIAAGIIAAASGDRVMSGAIANQVLDILIGGTSPKSFYGGLTAREVEILKEIAEGKGNKEIGRRLGISDKTVRNHVSHMYEKLGIYDRAQAVLFAVRKGLVEA